MPNLRVLLFSLATGFLGVLLIAYAYGDNLFAGFAGGIEPTQEPATPSEYERQVMDVARAKALARIRVEDREDVSSTSAAGTERGLHSTGVTLASEITVLARFTVPEGEPLRETRALLLSTDFASGNVTTTRLPRPAADGSIELTGFFPAHTIDLVAWTESGLGAVVRLIPNQQSGIVDFGEVALDEIVGVSVRFTAKDAQPGQNLRAVFSLDPALKPFDPYGVLLTELSPEIAAAIEGLDQDGFDPEPVSFNAGDVLHLAPLQPGSTLMATILTEAGSRLEPLAIEVTENQSVQEIDLSLVLPDESVP